jgi:hypothetical protein
MARRRSTRRGHDSAPPRDVYTGPPTVVSFEVDYSYGFPVVNRSPGILGGDVLSPEELGLSPELGSRLTAWADRWDHLAMRDVNGEPETPDSERQWADLARDKFSLLYELRRELDRDVDLLVDGVPLDEWRRGRRGH